MSVQPPAPAQMYIPPAAPPPFTPAAPAPQQPQGSPTEFAGAKPGGGGGPGAPSFLSSSAPAPASTGQRSLLGS